MPTEPTSSFLEKIIGTREERDKKALTQGIRTRRMARWAGLPEDFDKKTFEDVSGLAGTTKFITKGIPQVAERIGATKQFVEAMQKMGGKAAEAGELFAQRYPRVAAHINPMMAKLKQGTKGETHLRDAFKTEPKATVKFDPSYMGDIEDTLLHEGTHVAQRLGRPDVANLYYAADEVLTPRVGIKAAYELNPFEQSARRVAERKLGANLPPISALENLRSIVEKLPPGSPERIALAQKLMRR